MEAYGEEYPDLQKRILPINDDDGVQVANLILIEAAGTESATGTFTAAGETPAAGTYEVGMMMPSYEYYGGCWVLHDGVKYGILSGSIEVTDMYGVVFLIQATGVTVCKDVINLEMKTADISITSNPWG